MQLMLCQSSLSLAASSDFLLCPSLKCLRCLLSKLACVCAHEPVSSWVYAYHVTQLLIEFHNILESGPLSPDYFFLLPPSLCAKIVWPARLYLSTLQKIWWSLDRLDRTTGLTFEDNTKILF